jgi:hypothetical protein
MCERQDEKEADLLGRVKVYGAVENFEAGQDHPF